VSALREVFARFGVAFDAGPLAQGDAAVEGLIGRLQTLGNVVAGGAVVMGIRAFVADLGHVGDELDKTSQSLGLTTDALQEWRAAAGHAGVSSEQLTPALQSVRRNADAARMGAAGMAADFRALGVQVRGEHGGLRSTDDLMRQIADGLAGIEDPTRAAAIAMRLMGESGARLMPLFANGAAGVDEAAQAFRDLGGGMSEEAIAAAAEYTDRVQDMDDALTGLKSRISVYVLPIFTRLIEAATSIEAAFSRMTDRGYILEAAMVVLGTAAAVAGAKTAMAWIAAAAPFVVVGAAVLGLILIVEDLWLGFATGQGVIADLGTDLEAWGETTDGVLGEAVRQWEFFHGALLSVIQAFHELTGLGVDLSGGDGDIATTNATDQESQLANALVRDRRATSGVSEDMIPDSVERFDAVRQAREIASQGNAAQALADLASRAAARGQGGAPSVSQSVSIGRIDTSGMTPAQATAMVETAVRRALASDADETLDALAGGV